jgi:hypothetical protein
LITDVTEITGVVIKDTIIIIQDIIIGMMMIIQEVGTIGGIKNNVGVIAHIDLLRR